MVGNALSWARKQVGSRWRKEERREKIIKFADKYIFSKLSPLMKISLSFSPFERAFVEAYYNLGEVRKAIAHLKATLTILADIRDQEAFMARKGDKNALKRYAGRVRDVLERGWESIQLLRRFRNFLHKIPPVKDMPTVVIAGFPNVGKSTLLGKLTGSQPKVSPIPFTTKGIMIGYMKCLYAPVQVLDTPGILDKPIHRLKREEKVALSAIAHAADLVVFLIDPLQPLEPQLTLLKNVKHYTHCPILVVQNKTDVAGRAVSADLYISALTGDGIQALKEKICALLGWEHGAEGGSENNG